MGVQRINRGGLTPEGFTLLEQMAELGFVWDISHLTEEGVWQGLDLHFPRVCASHATPRALIPTDRHLSDDVIRAVAERKGVIGLVLLQQVSGGPALERGQSHSGHTEPEPEASCSLYCSLGRVEPCRNWLRSGRWHWA